MAASAPVVLVRLQSSHRFDQDTSQNLDKLVEKYQADIVTESQDLQALFKHRRPKVTVLADNALTLPENEDLRGLLFGYIKAGGTAILAFKFAVMSKEADLDCMFREIGIPMWTHASSSLFSYTRTNLYLHPVMQGTFGPAAFSEMNLNYPIKAVHLEGVDDREKVYYPWSKDSGAIAKIKGHDSACPSAFTKIGGGYLGYVGDFPLRFGTVKIIKAMIEKGLSAQTSVPSQHTTMTTRSDDPSPSSKKEAQGASTSSTLPPQPGASSAESSKRQPTSGPPSPVKSTAASDEDTDDEDGALAEGLEGLELEDPFDKMWS